MSSQNGYTVIEPSFIKGGAAEASGLLAVDDKILAVAQGTRGRFVPIIDMPLNEVVQKIRGPKGTKVRLKILRPKTTEGVTKNLEVTLVRKKNQFRGKCSSNSLSRPKSQRGQKRQGEKLLS